MDSENDSSDDTAKCQDTLDPASPHFDPFKALYAKSVKLPVPDAKGFNNLAEFENFLKGKDAASQKLNKPPKKKLPSIIAERAAQQAKEAVRKAAITAKNAGPSVRSATQERRNRTTNVLARMQKYDKGPMSILKRCVNEKLKVMVVIRAAVAVRGRCTGYIVAFDKHMNMALMDVDETFIRPCVKDKVETKEASSMEQLTDQEKVRPDMRTAGVVEKSETGKDAAQKGKAFSSYRIPKKKASSFASSSHFHQAYRSRLSEYVKGSATSREPWSDTEVHTHRHAGLKQETTRAHTDSEATTDSKETVKQRPKDDVKPFWSKYKEWTEARCYSKFEIIERHVNQLFIRGDNIVSVCIAN